MHAYNNLACLNHIGVCDFKICDVHNFMSSHTYVLLVQCFIGWDKSDTVGKSQGTGQQKEDTKLLYNTIHIAILSLHCADPYINKRLHVYRNQTKIGSKDFKAHVPTI